MKKIYLLFLLLLILPITTSALNPNYKIDGFYVQADVLTNGDMIVREQIVMTGAFNGYIRDLYYKGDYSLYDASKLEDVSVCDLQMNKKGIFDLSDSTYPCFKEVSYAVKGDSYVYTINEGYDYTSLTMYNQNTSGSKIFYITYTLKDVIVIHEDIAELYWTFIGTNFDDDIKDIRIEINLPDVAEDLRVWAHGPLEGNIASDGNNKIIATITDLSANNLIDIRSTFDKELIPLGSKFSNKKSFDDIIKIEEERADEANYIRRKAKAISNGVIVLQVLWFAGAIAIANHTYRKYDKEHKSSFKLEYHREFPAEYGPEVVEYLMKKNNTPLSLSAMILDIIRKKGFSVREETKKRNKKDYVLVKTNDAREELSKEEQYIVDWLIDDLGDSKEISLQTITNASKNNATATKFVDKYNKWLNLVKKEGASNNFFEEVLIAKIKGGMYAFLGFMLAITSLITNISPVISVIILVSSITLFIYMLIFSKRTKEGNDHFAKWKAFKKFLLDFGRFDEKELPEIILWDKYLVYATVFGIADKVAKEMDIKIKNMNVDSTMPIYSRIYFNHYFTSNLVSSINKTTTASMSKIAQSSMSSGSGFGGGFSGGGGFGGGGTGGGGRGF